MIRLIFALSFIIILTSCSIDKSSDFTLNLEKGFQKPPINAKPKGYWCWVNGNFDLSQMRKELKEYKDKGIGTLDIWDVAGWVDEKGVVPAGPSFMSDESVQAIAFAVREAGKIGIDIGLTVSSSWNAGGDWVEPAEGVMGMFVSSISVSGPAKISAEIPFPEIPEYYDNRRKNILFKDKNGLPTFYREISILAFQHTSDSVITEIIDLNDFFHDGKIVWDAPKGNWQISRYVCTGTGQPLMAPSPNSNGLMIDHFSADAMKKHLKYFFTKLEAELGDLSETALKYLYTDSYEANSAVWTPKLPEEFKDRIGYDITEYLPVLEGFIVKDKEVTHRFLFDYRQVLSDLIVENHYELGKKICREKGLEFIAEAGGPGPPIHNCPFESLSSLGNLSVPRGEFWFDTLWARERIDQLQIIKGPASAAHLYNQPRVEAEAFTGTQIWQFGPGDLKAAADRAMCEGLTSFVYHTSPHIPREAGIPGWVYNFGTIINTTRAWWPLSEGFHYYLGRSCFLLQQGNFVADVLYYYGDHAPNFVEAKHIDPSLGFGYDYDIVNSDIILNRLDFENGYYTLPHGQKYRILVLPDEDAMNPDVLKKLLQLVKKGGILVGNKPVKSHSLFEADKNDQLVKDLADELWNSNDQVNKLENGYVYTKDNKLRDVLEENGVQPDLQIKKEHPHKYIDFIHRQTDKEDIYFVRNITNEEHAYEFTLRSVKGAPELWDPVSSKTSGIPVFIQNENATILKIKLGPQGSTFIVFREGNFSDNIEAIKKDGNLIFPDGKYFPISFSNGNLVFLENGNYELSYSSGKKVNKEVTKCRSDEIGGSWQIRFPFGWGTPTRTEFEKLVSWTESEDPGIKYFSGVAEYHKSFNLSNEIGKCRVMLDLGNVSKVAKVYLNGHDLGTRWFYPYVFDVSDKLKKGKNNLTVEVANVMLNQLIGDSFREDRDKRTHTNITRGPNAWMKEYSNLDPVPSGLLGPVGIITEELF